MAKKTRSIYRVTNWKKYNESLVNRGDITLWFAEDVIAAWEHANREVKVGRPYTYSDTAIECLLALRELFQLPYFYLAGQTSREVECLFGSASRGRSDRHYCR